MCRKINKPFSMKYNIDNAKKILNALISAGAPVVSIPFLMAQVAHETGDFDSRVFRENNNASGIMFINKPLKQKNALRGRAFPRNEWPSPNRPLYYANFATLSDWAIDYLRIIGRTVLNSTTIEDYAVKLKNRGYYTASLFSYRAALISHLDRIKKLNLLKTETNTIPAILPAIIALAIVSFFIVK